MIATLRFARRLAEFTERVSHQLIITNDDPIVASYRELLDGLIEIDAKFPDADIPTLLSKAMDVYDQAQAMNLRREEDSQQRYEARRAEADRRHALAVQIECPTCGSPPGAPCQTRSGETKGIDDHVARRRAATRSGMEEGAGVRERDQV